MNTSSLLQRKGIRSLTVLGALLTGCGGGSGGGGGAEGGGVAPFFEKPFDDEFSVGNLFDHDLPLQPDANGYTVDFRGTLRNLGEPGASIDGHDGYDWGLPEGTPVKAVADGQVLFAGDGTAAPCPLLPGDPVVASKIVTIEHTTPEGDRYASSSGHFSTVAVTTGARVNAGETIGLSGNTGCSTAPHLHFEVHHWVNSQWRIVDPYGWTGAGADPWSEHADGATSISLWKDGQAPTLVLE